MVEKCAHQKKEKAVGQGKRRAVHHLLHSLAHVLAAGAGFAMLGIIILVIVLGSLRGRHMLVRGFLMPILSANGVVLDYKDLDTPDVRHWNFTDMKVSIPDAHLSVQIKNTAIALDYHALLLGRLGLGAVTLTGISTAKVPAALTEKTSFTAFGVVDVFGHGTDLKVSAQDVPLDLLAVIGGFTVPEDFAATLNGAVTVADETVHVNALTLDMRHLGVLKLDGFYAPNKGFDLHITGKNISAAVAQMLGIGKSSGAIGVDLSLQGTVQKPQLFGTLKLQNGYYEDITSGAILNKIDIVLQAQGQSLRIEKATAHDGGKGKLSLEGGIDLSTRDMLNSQINMTVEADHAQLLHRRDMTGSVTGGLTLAGTLRGMTLTGKLDVSPFNMSLESLTATSIPEIDVTDVTPGAEKQDEDSQAALPPVALDVTVNLAHQAFLHGMGVDAEVGGYIKLGGTLARSEYSGSFKTIRGSYEVFGKKFVLQQGQVDFEGDALLLNIVGVHHESGIDTTAKLSGSLKKISVTLSSVPSMPQDEILSHLLFGKSARSISPFQAVRLAAAIQQMRGGGGSSILDPVGAVRDTLGLDSLSVGSETAADGQQGVSVGAGKYIGDKVYLEVQKTPDPTRPFEAEVQIELTPHLNVKSGSGGPGGAGNIGLQWKKDY